MTSRSQSPTTPVASMCERRRALIVSPDGEHGLQLCAAVAASLPEYEWRVESMSSVTAWRLRRLGLNAHAAPWRHQVPVRSPWPSEPFSTELAVLGLSAANASAQYQRSVASIRVHAREVLDRWQPELLICFSTELALPRQFVVEFEQSTSAAGRLICLQPWHVRSQVLVHDFGARWQAKLAATEFPPGRPDTTSSPRNVLAELRSARRGYRLTLWATRAERLARASVRAVSLEHLPRTVMAPLLRYWHWPMLKASIVRAGDWPMRCAMVAAHRPAPIGAAVDWIALIEFALAATDEETTVLVRLHPAEPLPTLDKRTLGALRHPRVMICAPDAPGTIAEALPHCIACFTIASSSGLDAVRMEVPTFTLAPCYDARPGLAHAVQESDAHAVRRHLADLHTVRRLSPAVADWTDAVSATLGAFLPTDSGADRPATAVADRVRQITSVQASSAPWNPLSHSSGIHLYPPRLTQ